MNDNAKIRRSAQAGISAKEKYTALSLTGVRRDPGLAIFPIICQHADKKTLELVGTGFYVAKGGIFLTARHILETAQDDDERGPFALAIIHFMLAPAIKERLKTQFKSFDPVRLLQEMRTAQQILSEFAAYGARAEEAPKGESDVTVFLASLSSAWKEGEARPTH